MMADVIEMDVAQRIATILQLEPDRPAVQYLGRWQTWGQIQARVTGIDAALTAHGLGEGTPVGLITRNQPGHVAAIQALLTTLRCIVPITSIASDSLVATELSTLGVPALIATELDWDRAGLIERCAELGVLGIVVPADPGADVLVVPGLESGTATFEAMPEVAVLMPTSGTTGPPKRIRYLYRHINGALARVANYAPATARALGGAPQLRDGVVIAPLALAHIGGFWTVLQAVAEGRAISLMDRFDPLVWADLVHEHEAKTATLPPATLRMVLDADIDPARIATLRAVGCGTAPLDPALADAIMEKYGIPVLPAYGATEFPGGTVGWTLADHRIYWSQKRGSAGRARPGIEIRIVDTDTGVVLPPDHEGVLAVRSPQATGDTVDGWVRTNDLARLDADGFLWLIGRSDDAINRGGFKIIPQVVEAVLSAHPAVVDAGVVGIPDERLGELPVAAVTVRAPTTPQELDAWVRQHLASYQVPTEIRIVAELPRTTSLKVAKADLRRLFLEP